MPSRAQQTRRNRERRQRLECLLIQARSEEDEAEQSRLRRKLESLENQRFTDRLRFDQSRFWEWNYPAFERRSLPPSQWPAIEEALKKWGVPAGFRNTSFVPMASQWPRRVR